MEVKLSTVLVGSALLPKKILGIHYYKRLSELQSHNAAGRIRYIETSYDIGNRNRNLPVSSLVPQPATLPHLRKLNFLFHSHRVSSSLLMTCNYWKSVFSHA
jgi:hypothetical protein